MNGHHGDTFCSPQPSRKRRTGRKRKNATSKRIRRPARSREARPKEGFPNTRRGGGWGCESRIRAVTQGPGLAMQMKGVDHLARPSVPCPPRPTPFRRRGQGKWAVIFHALRPAGFLPVRFPATPVCRCMPHGRIPFPVDLPSPLLCSQRSVVDSSAGSTSSPGPRFLHRGKPLCVSPSNTALVHGVLHEEWVV